MNTINIVLITIAIMVLIEGAIISIFPKAIKKALKELKTIKKIRKIGLMELIIALILLVISSLI